MKIYGFTSSAVRYASVSLNGSMRSRGYLRRDGYLLQVGLVSEIIFVLSFCICIISLHFLSKSDQKDKSGVCDECWVCVWGV